MLFYFNVSLAGATTFRNVVVSPQICVVKERNPTEMRDLPSRYVEIGIKHSFISRTHLTRLHIYD